MLVRYGEYICSDVVCCYGMSLMLLWHVRAFLVTDAVRVCL